MRRGPCFKSWRTSSEPMEPPAPVIRIDLPRDLRAKQVDVGRHLVTAEQVVDLDGAQIGDADAPRGDVLHRRQHLHLDRLVLKVLEDAATLAPPIVGQGDEDFLHLMPLDEQRQLVGVVHLDAGNVLPP